MSDLPYTVYEGADDGALKPTEENGVYTGAITLNPGWYVDLPAETQYAVTEDDANMYGYRTTVDKENTDSAAGSVQTDTDGCVEFVNAPSIETPSLGGLGNYMFCILGIVALTALAAMYYKYKAKDRRLV